MLSNKINKYYKIIQMNITVNSINSDLLMKITNELQRIIIYIQEHLINIKKNWQKHKFRIKARTKWRRIIS